MSGIKKERWTEGQVVAFPAGEHDYFDRKSGDLLTDSDFREKCAKALSAFANSGGGHLLLGVRDDGTFDGVTPLRGRTPTREWIEQIIPALLSHPLEDFRVHQVEATTPSAIPSGRVVIVIDVGDSVLAPHQAVPNRTYYYREGGHSKPAPHFYLETLRNRLVRPLLEAELIGIDLKSAEKNDDGVLLRIFLIFHILNKGRVAAYKWALSIDSVSGLVGDRTGDYGFSLGRGDNLRLDDTILPSLALSEKRSFELQLRPTSFSKEHLIAELRAIIPSEFELKFRVVSETSPGELRSKKLADLIDYDEFVETVLTEALKSP